MRGREFIFTVMTRFNSKITVYTVDARMSKKIWLNVFALLYNVKGFVSPEWHTGHSPSYIELFSLYTLHLSSIFQK